MQKNKHKTKTKAKWQVYNRHGFVIVETDNLDYAWQLCDVAAKCGHALDVRKAK